MEAQRRRETFFRLAARHVAGKGFAIDDCRQHTVLAVDDDESILRLMHDILAARKYRVITGRTGRDALAKVRETMPDLVILDGMLPEVHGFEICRQLKSSERFRHIPVIMVSAVHTGWRFAADVKEKYGADDYMEKPFEAADLLRRVEVLLNRVPSGVAPDSEAAARQHLKEGVIALKQENCTVCFKCSRECPDWCIYIDSHKEQHEPASGGGRFGQDALAAERVGHQPHEPGQRGHAHQRVAQEGAGLPDP